MKQIFGASFVTIYGETPAPLWLQRIDELTDDECRAGLDTITRERREYPCNLTEFVEACRPEKLKRYCSPPPPDRALPKPRATRAHVDGCLQRMRAALGRRA